MGHVRVICRLRAWSAAKGLSPWRLKAVEIAYFLRDSSHGCWSVPKSLFAGLEWLHTALQLPWKLDDFSITAFTSFSAREASAARVQAAPYTYQVCLDLLCLLATVADDGAVAFTLMFMLCPAFGCLGFSDLDRSINVVPGKDSLHGTSWRSKGKDRPTPWAALRKTWDGVDWGGHFFQLVTATLPSDVKGKPRDWLWPAMFLDNGNLQFYHPTRHGSYANCLMAVMFVHRLAGHKQHYTLHSPRFLICGMAGQAGFTMEQRRSMGRWGPASGMPVRYDQSRCCAELAAKHSLWEKLRQGFRPGDSFELPSQDKDAATLRASAECARAERTPGGAMGPGPKRRRQTTATPVSNVITNCRTGVLRKDPPCKNTRNIQLSRYERTTEQQENLRLYVRCLLCFVHGASPIEIPEWDHAASEEGEGEQEASSRETDDTSSGTEQDETALLLMPTSADQKTRRIAFLRCSSHVRVDFPEHGSTLQHASCCVACLFLTEGCRLRRSSNGVI